MSFSQNKNWFLGIVAFVALFTGSSVLFSSELSDQSVSVPFSDLTDSDFDMILAVKAEMHAANEGQIH